MEPTKKITLLEEYYPKSWEDLILPSRIIQILKESKATKGFRLLFHSSPGTGKTTSARIITIGDETLYLSGSNDFNIDVLRNKVYTFAGGMSINNKPKTIIIDEAENIKDALQDAFKVILDKSSCNFIFVTNEIHKMNDAIRSRCTNIDYDFVGGDLEEQKKLYVQFALRVCKEKNITYDNQGIKTLFQLNFPDFRHLLVNLQQIIDSKESVTYDSIRKFAESGKQMLDLYSIIMNISLSAKEFYAETSKFKGKEKEAFESLGEPFFLFLNDKGLYDKTLESAIIVSKYSNLYLNTINKFTTFFSCLVELKTIFR